MNFSTLSTSMPFLEILLRSGVATVIGCALGLNREIHGKPAGMRTHALVALGTALVTLTGMVLAGQDGKFDSNSVSRVIQGIVAGIGFLGGGTILKSDTGEQISGLPPRPACGWSPAWESRAVQACGPWRSSRWASRCSYWSLAKRWNRCCTVFSAPAAAAEGRPATQSSLYR